MQLIHTLAQLRAARHAQTQASVAFVPTMGNLHEGHLALVRQARALADFVVASLFVNRLQFLPGEDFERYPRTLEADCEKLQSVGCDAVFAPDERVIYPSPQRFKVHPPPELADILEGHFRPGFFVGVSTVVMKLLSMVQPQVAVFGQKDFQQLLVIRQMVEQFALPVQIVGVRTERAPDGLALSSRNAYLSAAERAKAPALFEQLQKMRLALRGTAHPNVNALALQAQQTLCDQGWDVDYITVRRQSDLQLPTPEALQALGDLREGPDSLQTTGAGHCVILAAAKLGRTRLIDNLEV